MNKLIINVRLNDRIHPAKAAGAEGGVGRTLTASDRR